MTYGFVDDLINEENYYLLGEEISIRWGNLSMLTIN